MEQERAGAPDSGFTMVEVIVALALIGIVATCLTIATALGWAGYHLYRALALYLGG